MNNIDIRRKAAGEGIKLWQIADAIGLADSLFSRKLRYELPEEQKKEIFEVIDKLSAEDAR